MDFDFEQRYCRMRCYLVGMGSRNLAEVVVVGLHGGDDDDQQICVCELIDVHVGSAYRLSSPETTQIH